MNHPSGHKDTEDDYFSAVGSDHEQDSNDEGRSWIYFLTLCHILNCFKIFNLIFHRQ